MEILNQHPEYMMGIVMFLAYSLFGCAVLGLAVLPARKDKDED